jgi:hypothetical protein
LTTKRQDINIVGNNKQLFRGQVDTCDIIVPLANKQARQQTSIQETKDQNRIFLEQFNLNIQTNANQHLCEYFDWQQQLQEQVNINTDMNMIVHRSYQHIIRLGST